MLSLPQYREQQLVASASFFEIYGGKVSDLVKSFDKWLMNFFYCPAFVGFWPAERQEQTARSGGW